jgi:hypothetical protein
MTRSYLHRCRRDAFAHYLSPLHLLSPMILLACRTKRPVLRILLFSLVRGYERIFRVVFMLGRQ